MNLLHSLHNVEHFAANAGTLWVRIGSFGLRPQHSPVCFRVLATGEITTCCFCKTDLASKSRGVRRVDLRPERLIVALSRFRTKNAKSLRAPYFQAAATAVRHVSMAAARKARCVRADVRWRWTLKVL